MRTGTSTACSAGSTTTVSVESTSRTRGHRLVRDIRRHDVGKYTTKVINFLEGAALSIGKLLFSAIVVLVVSIYMLLDFPKLERAVNRRFHPSPDRSR